MFISRLDWKCPTSARRNATPHQTHANNANESYISTSTIDFVSMPSSNPNKILTLNLIPTVTSEP